MLLNHRGVLSYQTQKAKAYDHQERGYFLLQEPFSDFADETPCELAKEKYSKGPALYSH